MESPEAWESTDLGSDPSPWCEQYVSLLVFLESLKPSFPIREVGTDVLCRLQGSHFDSHLKQSEPLRWDFMGFSPLHVSKSCLELYKCCLWALLTSGSASLLLTSCCPVGTFFKPLSSVLSAVLQAAESTLPTFSPGTGNIQAMRSGES